MKRLSTYGFLRSSALVSSSLSHGSTSSSTTTTSVTTLLRTNLSLSSLSGMELPITSSTKRMCSTSSLASHNATPNPLAGSTFPDPSRGVVVVSGRDAKEFLHGLTTNDIHARLRPGRCLFTGFLNTQGRVLMDAFITEVPNTAAPTILIEVEGSLTETLCEHLKEFKLRRKVKIENISGLVSVRVGTFLENGNVDVVGVNEASPPIPSKYFGNSNVITVPDPRSFAVESFLNYEVALNIPESIADVPEGTAAQQSQGEGAANSEPTEGEQANNEDGEEAGEVNLRPTVLTPHPFLCRQYVPTAEAAQTTIAIDDSSSPRGALLFRALECIAGVPCGPSVYIPNKSLPFEGNIDQLGAVSFHKGCYIGQELTHRTHTMLVTRKRTTPLILGHFDDIDDVFSKLVRTNKTVCEKSDEVKSPSAEFKNNCQLEASIAQRVIGIDTTVEDDIWGVQLTSSNKAEEGEKEGTLTSVSSKGYQLYYAKPNKSGDENAAPALTPVGFVQQSIHNVASASLRLRFADAEHRVMKILMKNSKDELVPVTAFLPPWWSEEEIVKAIS